jgi:hypothetical protein
MKDITVSEQLKQQFQAALTRARNIAALGDGIEVAEPVAQALVRAGKGRSAGEQFVAAPEFRGWLERMAPPGRSPSRSSSRVAQ